MDKKNIVILIALILMIWIHGFYCGAWYFEKAAADVRMCAPADAHICAPSDVPQCEAAIQENIKLMKDAPCH